MNKITQLYKGLPKQVWFFFLMILINRVGAMVVPFLSKYLYEDLRFDYQHIGTIMLFFGIGSFVGTFLGGRLTKYISTYRLMFLSMLLNGVLLFLMQYIREFYSFCFMVFLLNVVADMFRPAMIATLKDYVSKIDRVRAFALVRAASNFGFVVSPVIAGLLIVSFGYKYLFIVDGLTSVVAICVFVFFIREKKLLHKLKFQNLKEERFVFFKDKLLLTHCLVTVLKGIVFFQIFTVLPLFYDVYLKLPDTYNSIYLFFYGAILFIFELPIVSMIKKSGLRMLNSILYGILLIGFGYLILAIFPSFITVFVSLIFISFGVIFSFPFAPDFVLERSYKNQEAKFLSYFQMSYGLAHIFSAKLGMYVVEHFGYKSNFVLNFVIALAGALICYKLIHSLIKERKSKKKDIVSSIFG